MVYLDDVDPLCVFIYFHRNSILDCLHIWNVFILKSVSIFLFIRALFLLDNVLRIEWIYSQFYRNFHFNNFINSHAWYILCHSIWAIDYNTKMTLVEMGCVFKVHLFFFLFFWLNICDFGIAMVQLLFQLCMYNVEFFPQIFSQFFTFIICPNKIHCSEKKLNSFEITLCSSLVRVAKSSLKSSNIANKLRKEKKI